VLAPLAVKLKLLPEQIVELEEVNAKLGDEKTVTASVLVSLHNPLKPVTVYWVEILGDTTIKLPLAPVFHE
jgi:hypothetical protein